MEYGLWSCCIAVICLTRWCWCLNRMPQTRCLCILLKTISSVPSAHQHCLLKQHIKHAKRNIHRVYLGHHQQAIGQSRCWKRLVLCAQKMVVVCWCVFRNEKLRISRRKYASTMVGLLLINRRSEQFELIDIRRRLACFSINAVFFFASHLVFLAMVAYSQANEGEVDGNEVYGGWEK